MPVWAIRRLYLKRVTSARNDANGADDPSRGTDQSRHRTPPLPPFPTSQRSSTMDVIGAIGPGSDMLPNNSLQGYQPVSRNGEVTQNAFIDGQVWNMVMDKGRRSAADNPLRNEDPCQFFEWASVQPGFICVFEKDRSTRYRNHLSTETACPVIACAQTLGAPMDKKFAFAGVARSKSVRDHDDIANGAKRDEYFTLSIGGPVTLINNGNGPIKAGDMVEWTFFDTREANFLPKRQRVGPRRIQVRAAKHSQARTFGRALNYAKRGESLDVLVGSASM